MPVSPARAAAFDILLRVERESSYASDLLHSAAYDRLSDSRSRARHRTRHGRPALAFAPRRRDCHRILAATVRNSTSKFLSRCVWRSISFCWLDRVPQRAALHESVELVKRARKRSAAPFVNAVLRKLSAAPPNSAKARAEDESFFTRSPGRRSCASAMACRALGPRIRTLRRPPNLPIRSIHSRYRNPPSHARLRKNNSNQEGITLSPGAFWRPPAASKLETSQRPRHSAPAKIVIQDEASQLVAALVGGHRTDQTFLTAAPLPAARRSPSPTSNPSGRNHRRRTSSSSRPSAPKTVAACMNHESKS